MRRLTHYVKRAFNNFLSGVAYIANWASSATELPCNVGKAMQACSGQRAAGTGLGSSPPLIIINAQWPLARYPLRHPFLNFFLTDCSPLIDVLQRFHS